MSGQEFLMRENLAVAKFIQLFSFAQDAVAH